MAEHVSRRRVLRLSGASLGTLSLTYSLSGRAETDEATVEGWVTKGEKSRIAEQNATIETIEDPGSTLCNGGELYQCRTCSGYSFYLIVGFGTPQPSVGRTYRFEPTGKDNWCGNFQVRLVETDPCETAAATDDSNAGTPVETNGETTTTTETTDTTTETTTETTTATETTTTTTETPTTTTETTTETPTTQTTTETTTTTADAPVEDTATER